MTKEIERAWKEYDPIQLPIIQAACENTVISYSVLKLEGIIKKQIIHVVNNRKSRFNKEVEKVLQTIWDKAYSEGLKHMDKMHGKIDDL